MRLRERFAKWRADMKRSQEKAAKQEVLRTLFDDLYADRRRIYQLNFVRGIFFGLGSVLGGTIIVAVAIWILTWFVDFPLIGEWIQKLINTLP